MGLGGGSLLRAGFREMGRGWGEGSALTQCLPGRDPFKLAHHQKKERNCAMILCFLFRVSLVSLCYHLLSLLSLCLFEFRKFDCNSSLSLRCYCAFLNNAALTVFSFSLNIVRS